MEKHQAIQILNEQKDHDVGGWKILEYVNHGGSAAVYKATREDVSSALKIIDPGIVEKFGRDEQIERIRRESNLIDHSHPNLVRIFDADVCERTSYLYVAMEFLELPTLTKRIPEFPHERIIPIISQIASAAKYLENQGFIHRDIKPDNIVMERDFSKAILLDLGVIRPASEYLEDITSSSAFLGTTRYSAPEYLQRSGAEKNIECWRALTFYQLGALLHDMIMRKRIFDEIDGPPVALTDAVRYKKPVVDNSACNHISNLARNCLEKDWELRLELVTWDDFLQSTELNEQKPAEHRIASRIEASRKSQGTKNIITPRLSKRKTVERVRSQIIFLLREQCTDVGLFPALRIEGSEARKRMRRQFCYKPDHRKSTHYKI